ncbi:hypothetical protein MUK42_14846 [Musa troglodytarum]|uniref:Nuclease associated modular domain-containing protein n=1 Tax=Musa troglodytarum TaxID=320322 RepID=A0A9E7I0R6_9LILI|nr:hypothetical protein MUK42_14846 [Musa troglodytarum]
MAASSLVEVPIFFARRTKTKASFHSLPPPPKWHPLLCHGRLRTKSPLRAPIRNPRHEFIRIICGRRPAAASGSPPYSFSWDGNNPFSGRLFSSVLETLTGAKWPSIAAVLLGALLTVADPCAASCDFLHSAYSWPQSAPSCAAVGSLFESPTDVFQESGGCFLLIMVVSSLAAALLAELLPDTVFGDDGSHLSLRVQKLFKIRSLQRIFYQFSRTPDIRTMVILSYVLADVYAKRTFFVNQLGASGRSSVCGRRIGFQLNHRSHISTRNKQHGHYMKAVATVDSKFLVSASSENTDEHIDNLPYSSISDSKMLQSSTEENTPEIDEREKLRRMRISKANKGNVPWNKGRKHSAETLQRIRERTRLAMQDPKVMSCQGEVGKLWTCSQRRHQKLMIQEGCVFEWHNIIAAVAREGFAGEDELQWSSYKILSEQLQREWLESIEKRKTMPRPKGSKRAPKSLEQRRKISEAISAKWADPEYRDRVCSALAKYHGTTVGAERRQRRKASGGTPLRWNLEKKKFAKSNSISDEAKSIKKVVSKRKSTPSYKDPMASSKLEMIKKIRAQREEMEIKKREATERAKLLIAEAEKAAQALELAALTNPVAQASLLETRKLIVEATQSIKNIERGQLTSQGTRDQTFSDSVRPNNHLQNSPGNHSGPKWPSKLVNGTHLLSSSISYHRDLDFVNLSPSTEETSGNDSFLHDEFLMRKSAMTDNQMVFSKFGGSIRYKNLKSEEEESDISEMKNSETSGSSLLLKKNWVRGRLVEVEEEDDVSK